MSPVVWIWLVGLLSLALSFLFVGLARRWGPRMGLVDRPRPGEIQAGDVPRSGGYGMLAGLALALLVGLLIRPSELGVDPAEDTKLLGLLLGMALIVPLGFLDDRRRLGPIPQLIWQVVIAAVPVALGVRMGSLASPFGEAVELPYWLDLLLSILWIVGMINAINLIDVMDGLAAGVAVVAALVLFARSLWFEQVSIAVLPLALAGCALGLLPRNFHPASVFMGTSGSVLLGYSLATMSIVGGAKVGTAFAVLSIPILDTAWVMLGRLVAGRSPLRGGDFSHLPQRIHALGLSQLQTVLLLYALSGIFGWLALSLHSPPEGPGLEKFWLVLGIVVVIVGVLASVALLSARRRGSGVRS